MFTILSVIAALFIGINIGVVLMAAFAASGQISQCEECQKSQTPEHK